jgi:hypothetical protein
MFDFMKKTVYVTIDDIRGKEWEDLACLAAKKVSQGPKIDNLVRELITAYKGKCWANFNDVADYRKHPVNIKGREIGRELHGLANNDVDAFYLMQFVAYRVSCRAKGDSASLLNSVWHKIGQWRH